MKKILLGTTALIGAVTLYAGAASAEDPKVTVGGFNTFEAGYTSSDFDAGERNQAFRNVTELHFNVAGKTDAGLGYGAEVDLQADINGASSAGDGSTGSGSNARRTYAWLQGDQWGHVEFGSNDGAARTMKVDAANIARATGGVDGDWSYFADVNVASTTTPTGGASGAFAGGAAFITAPRLPVEHGPATGYAMDTYANSTKVTYYTPRFSGLQLGVSYAPNLTDSGQTTNRNLATVLAGDIWEGGLNYEGQFDQIGVAAAVTGETGETDATAGNDLSAWNVGAKVAYMGFSVAGSYGDWKDSFAATGTDADYWTLGAAYENGPIGASVTYFESSTQPTGADNKFKDVSVGVDYKLAPGLTPFVEYTWYNLDTESVTAENKGNVILVGSQLSF